MFRAATAVALLLALAGCTKGGQFDPTDMFNSDVFDSKKKIKGEREPLFPNGVPGTTTGVPPDLVKGYQPPPDQAADASALPPASNAGPPGAGPPGAGPPGAGPPGAGPSAPPATAAAKPKPKPKPKVAAAPAQGQDAIWNKKPAGPTRINVGAAAPAPAASQTAWPAPPAPATSQTAWPAPPAAPAQQSQSIWPNPPAAAPSR